MVGTCVNVKIWQNTPSLGMIYKLAPDTDEGSNVGDVADHFKNKLCSQENNLDKIKIVKNQIQRSDQNYLLSVLK